MSNRTALAADQAASGAVADPLIPPGGRYVVGFDGSTAARIALAWTIARAREVGRPVVLVGVVDDSAGAPGTGWAEQSGPELAGVLASRANELQDAGGDLQVSTALVQGDVATSLVRSAEEGDGVVIGSDKTGYAQGRIFGIRSVQLAAIARGVLVVVPIVDLRLRHGVVVAVDEVAELDHLVRVGAREAARSSAPLLLVHALPAGADAERRERGEQLLVLARQVAAEEPGTVEVVSHLVQRRPAEAILNFTRDRALLVVGASRKGGALGVGRTLHDLLVNLNVPMVVLPRD